MMIDYIFEKGQIIVILEWSLMIIDFFYYQSIFDEYYSEKM